MRWALDEMVERVTQAMAWSTPVERVVVDGDPDRVLADVARRDLLVVGCPDHDRLAHLLTGSTRGYLMRHGPGPVVVVRPARAVAAR